MAAVRMMEAPLDEMVDVVAMRNRLMTAPGPMGMAGFVTIAAELRRAPVRVLGADLNHALVANRAADRTLRRADIVVIFSPSQSRVTLNSLPRAGSADGGDGNRLPHGTYSPLSRVGLGLASGPFHPVKRAKPALFNLGGVWRFAASKLFRGRASLSAAPSPVLWPQASASASAA